MKTIERLLRKLVREAIAAEVPELPCRVCKGSGTVAGEFCATCSGDGKEVDYSASRLGVGRGPLPHSK